MGVSIDRIESVRSASDEQIADYVAYLNALRAESHPNEHPISEAAMAASLRKIPEQAAVWPWWLGREAAGTVVAECHVFEAGNAVPDLPKLELGVLRDHRRQGIGSSLLGRVATEARRQGKDRLRVSTRDFIPAGAAFCERVGATAVEEAYTTRLILADVERELLRRWIDGAPAEGYSLIGFDGRCPDELVASLVALLGVVVGDLDDVESFRASERIDLAGTTRWTLVVRDDVPGGIVGMTEIAWYDNHPETIHQRNTIVPPEHRGSGIGKWLKATMLSRVLNERPEAIDILTDDVSTNAPMVAINEQLGFQPYIARRAWEIEIERLPEDIA